MRYAQSLGVKYAAYRDAAELAEKVAEAVGDELIRRYREHSLSRSDLPPIIDLLEEMAAGTAHIGGSFFGGNVNNRGGFLVGGNYTVNVALDMPPLDLLRAYYTSLAAECCRLPLGVIDVEYVRTSGVQPIPLPDIYVNLDVVAAPEEKPDRSGRRPADAERTWALRLMRGEGGDRTPLLEALAAPRQPGQYSWATRDRARRPSSTTWPTCCARAARRCPKAGAGCCRCAWCCAMWPHATSRPRRRRARRRCCGTRCMATSRRGWGPMPRTGCCPTCATGCWRRAASSCWMAWTRCPRRGGAARVLLAAVRELADVLSKTPSRILVTARPYAYADRQWRLPRFATLALAPFNEAQIGRFVDRWYDAVRFFMGWGPSWRETRGAGYRPR